jgi:hypothetical protein
MEPTNNKNNHLVEKIQRHTNYTEEQAKTKLIEHNYDEICVIKEYLGIDVKNKKEKKINSANQEIYTQIRNHLNQPNNAAKYMEFNPDK